MSVPAGRPGSGTYIPDNYRQGLPVLCTIGLKPLIRFSLQLTCGAKPASLLTTTITLATLYRDQEVLSTVHVEE